MLIMILGGFDPKLRYIHISLEAGFNYIDLKCSILHAVG